MRGYTQLSSPSALQVIPDGGRIDLSWEANSEFDVDSYRVYAGFQPDSTSYIATVKPSAFPQINIASVLPLPEEFNIADMGLDILASRDVVASEFARMFDKQPTSEEVDILFSGGRLPRDEIAPLNRERPYYFRVSAVNTNGYESAATAGRVFSASNVPVEVSQGAANAVSGSAWVGSSFVWR